MDEDDRAAIWKPPTDEAPARYPRASVEWGVAAVLASAFLPGTGQLINGRPGRAALMFVLWTISWILRLPPVWTLLCIISPIDAWKECSRQRRENDAASGPGAQPT